VGEAPDARRFMISYAHQSTDHFRMVGDLADFLRSRGFNVWLDQYATGERQDWVQWTLEQMTAATRVLVICSPAYRRRFERECPPDEGRGVQLESMLIRNEIMRDQQAAVRRFLPVLLGDATVDDIPTLLAPYAGTHYPVTSLTDHGCASLLRVLSGQPDRMPGPLGEPRPSPQPWPRVIVRLQVSGGTSLDRDDVARAFIASAAHDPTAAIVEFGPDGAVSGALLTAAPDDPEDVVGRGVRAVHERVQGADRPLWARIGGHVPDGPDDDTAFRLAESSIARALHRARGGRTVVVASPAYHELVRSGVVSFPLPSAYRLHDGDWFALPARSICPEVPDPSLDESTADGRGIAGPHVFVGQNNGFVQTVAGDSTIHIGDVINCVRGPR
jgi:SEFIR domain-containing protein